MHPESPAIDPVLSNGEREELRHLEYLSARVKELLDRGLISSESYAAIDADGRVRRDAIERRGRYQAAIARANALAKGRPAEALSWAEQARELEPDRSEPWSMAVDLLWTLERDDEAVALCALAAARFPHFEQKQEVLRSHLPVRAEARRLKAEQARREQELSDKMATARLAMRDGRDSEAVGPLSRGPVGRTPTSRCPPDGRVRPPAARAARRGDCAVRVPGHPRALESRLVAVGQPPADPPEIRRDRRGRPRNRRRRVPKRRRTGWGSMHRRRDGRGRASPPSSSRSTGRS